MSAGCGVRDAVGGMRCADAVLARVRFVSLKRVLGSPESMARYEPSEVTP